jgi:hypothetical protein
MVGCGVRCTLHLEEPLYCLQAEIQGHYGIKTTIVPFRNYHYLINAIGMHFRYVLRLFRN